MKTKLWIIILSVVLLACGGLSIWLLSPGETANQAEIWLDGALYKTVDLNRDQEFVVNGPYGSNTITIKDGKIAVTAADCPDHYCVERGFCNSGAQIVCLPHRLVIKFLGAQEVDGAVG